MVWRIEFLAQVEKDLRKLDPPAARRIIKFLRDRISTLDDPRSLGEALTGPEFGAFWKYRVGDYRVIADIRDREIVIVVVRIGNRREIYR